MVSRWWIALTFLLALACTTRLYPGPKRPDADIAAIESDGVRIVAVDDQATESGSRFEVTPGAHAVTLLIGYGLDEAGRVGRLSRNAIAVCFTARAGHIYLARPVYTGAVWHPEIIDENLARVVAATSTSAVAPDCPPPPSARPPTVPGLAPAIVAEVPHQPATDSGGVPEAAQAESDGVLNPAEPAAITADPPIMPARPSDTEVPRIKPRPPPASNLSAAPRPPYHPGTAIGLEVGYDAGGDAFDYRSSFHAGDGMALSLFGSITPAWIKERAGFGVGASLGWKYNNGEAGSGSFSRFPIAAFTQFLLRLHGRLFMLFRLGTVRVVSATLSGNAGSSTELSSSQGAFMDWGIYRGIEDVMGLAFVVRYTRLELSYAGSPIGADSIGAAVGVFFGD